MRGKHNVGIGHARLGSLLRWGMLVVATMGIGACGKEAGQDESGDDVREKLSELIRREMADKQIPALSIALVDGQQVVWAQGFGVADPQTGKAADADTVYRVGSVSKLFTDIAVMQQVEQGKLDIDAPVSRVLPQFHPRNPFGAEPTLRQIMAHRGGVVREPPVGNYFDAGSPTLEATVASLNDTQLVYAPGAQRKYSNAGVSVVGRALEVETGTPFVELARQALLDPLGMRASGFAPPLSPNLAKGQMWTIDGRVFAAPDFPLGTGPAGNLQSSANDMARFIRMLLADGSLDGQRVLQPQTLQAMWTPAEVEDCASACYGIGFRLDKLDGHRRVGHGGAVYGFSTQFNVLPDDKLGVVVMASSDGINAVVDKIADAALRALLASRARQPFELPPPTTPLPEAKIAQWLGRYRADDGSEVELTQDATTRDPMLFDLAGGSPLRLRARADGQLLVDGRLGQGGEVGLDGEALAFAGKRYLRQPPQALPAAAPESLRGLLGEYGWDHNVLYAFEKDGKLWVLIEWFEFDPMRERDADTFDFPDASMYRGEAIHFERDAGGRATAAIVAGVRFPRRSVGPEDGAPQLFVKPLRPVADLLREARTQTPPEEQGDFLPPDLVDVHKLDPKIHLDVRYASENNFLRTRFYPQARVFQQRPGAEALARVQKRLEPQGYGLLLHDGYRPWFVTKVFWDATPDAQKEFVADPSKGSMHNRGAAIDLSLYDLATGEPVQMVGTYDETTPRSYADYPGGTSRQRWLRQLLRQAMEAEGYTVLPNEWWHFDYKDWRRYRIGNRSFEELDAAAR